MLFREFRYKRSNSYLLPRYLWRKQCTCHRYLPTYLTTYQSTYVPTYIPTYVPSTSQEIEVDFCVKKEWIKMNTFLSWIIVKKTFKHFPTFVFVFVFTQGIQFSRKFCLDFNKSTKQDLLLVQEHFCKMCYLEVLLWHIENSTVSDYYCAMRKWHRNCSYLMHWDCSYLTHRYCS